MTIDKLTPINIIWCYGFIFGDKNEKITVSEVIVATDKNHAVEKIKSELEDFNLIFALDMIEMDAFLRRVADVKNLDLKLELYQFAKSGESINKLDIGNHFILSSVDKGGVLINRILRARDLNDVQEAFVNCYPDDALISINSIGDYMGVYKEMIEYFN